MKRISFILSFLLVFILVGCSKEITLSFDTDGAGTVDSIVFEKGDTIELPTVTKTGYTFKGWFLNPEFSIEYEEDKIKEDATLYAKWEVIKFTVVFKNGDETLKTDEVEYGKSATPPASPSKEGFDFTGWDKGFSNVTSDLIINATFSVSNYTVVFLDFDGTQIGEDILIEHGNDVTPPANPTRAGYVFDGWDAELTNITENTTINATYIPEVYTVIFRDHDNTVLKQITEVSYGQSVTPPEVPTRIGYDFLEWDNDYNEITANISIRARYTPTDYTIEYYDGTTLLSHSPETYTILDSVNLSTYDKTDFLFVGWYTDVELQQEINSISKGTHENIKVYGKWLDLNNKHNLSYELNGGVWTWEYADVTNPGSGIDSISNLPEIFMEDYYTYLKDNDLLSSSKVASSLIKTNWESFKANYTDPVAIYNHTSTNLSSSPDGYSQFFYTSATGDTSTSKITNIEGGFFGTEPYKSKYASLAQLLAYMMPIKYSGNYFWGGESAKALVGFILDGYFYGTQGAGTGGFLSLRSIIPNTNKMVNFASNVATLVDKDYQILEYVQGLEVVLVSPVKQGYAFRGWYDNAEFTNEPVSILKADDIPAVKYYAKWELIE